jgi:NAD(P)-dependent dehydrogenase (short-subunit alcohol dehydrogenase family)
MAGTVVITGPNGGMTTITVRKYAKANPDDHLVLLVRKPNALPSDATPASTKVRYVAFDMTDLAAVRSAADSIVAQMHAGDLPRIKTVVCSAAIQVVSTDHPRVTKDGYEETTAVNHLAHFELILDLLPAMASDGQIVIVGSDTVSCSNGCEARADVHVAPA